MQPEGQLAFRMYPVHQGGRSRNTSTTAYASALATHASAWATLRLIDQQVQNRHSKLHNRAVAAYNAAEERLAELEGRPAVKVMAMDWASRNAAGVMDRSRR